MATMDFGRARDSNSLQTCCRHCSGAGPSAVRRAGSKEGERSVYVSPFDAASPARHKLASAICALSPRCWASRNPDEI
jgi:hypothetical protein